MNGFDRDAARAQARAAQQQVVTADPPFAVIACPGAGKTRVIVDRHLSRAVPVRQGRAIAAFTRVAAAEVHRRCMAVGRLDLTDHPHFIGTLDTFLWLHLVRPFLPADRVWRRLESWRDAPDKSAKFVCDQTTYRLADADFSYNPYTNRWSVRPNEAARRGWLPGSWKRLAYRARTDLERVGYLTGAELRFHACRNLATRTTALSPLLTAKYAELVVDEAQDCSAADLYILDRLHDLGLPLIIVADPDQAIYDFRGAATQELIRLAGQLGRHELTYNWRSTTTICTVAATMRGDASRRTPDTAVADHHDAPYPVLIYASRDSDAITADFLGYAAKLGISPCDCLILAHAQETLPKTYAGTAKQPSPKAAALAWAIGIITEYPATARRVRGQARSTLSRAVLRTWYSDADDRTLGENLAANGLDSAAFERLLYRIAKAMPSLDQPMSTWVPAAAAVLGQHPPAEGAVRTMKRLACPRHANRTARDIAGLPPKAATGAQPQLSTVHRVKGDQAEAVLLLIRADDEGTSTAWLAGGSPDSETAEALRVVYVGVTRARRLLGLAIPPSDGQRVLAFLLLLRRARHKGKTVTSDDEDVPLLGAETVCAAVHLMSQLYDLAMKETPPIVMVNPFAGLDLPEIRPHGIDFLERDEAEALYDAAGESGARWRTLIELGTEVGLRPGELYGLHGHRVDWLRGKVQVIDVMTRSGLRQWPKSKTSHRVVPVPAHILEGMSALMTERPRDALVFTAPEGGPVDDGNFRDRIWYPAVEAAGIRRFPPRIMRHTAASWLVIDGVPLYDVQALLGHESYRTTERYAHLAPDAHDKVVQSWARRHDASVTHERKKGRPG